MGVAITRRRQAYTQMICFNERRWNNLLTAAEVRSSQNPPFMKLAEHYDEPGRHYHNAKHIDECLAEFDHARELALSPVALEFAIWFHDIIYDPHATNNEEQSARFAVEFLQAFDNNLAGMVSDLVLTTKTHRALSTPDAPLLIDIDLAILGQPPPRFAEYENGIRQEYSRGAARDLPVETR